MNQPITRRNFTRLAAATAAAAATPDRPNVMLILVDDLGWKDAAFMGGDIPTPTSDRIAREGVRLTQLCFLPLGTPLSSALLTGRSPVRYGLIYSVIRPRSAYGIPAEELMLSEVFQRAGYQTAAIGKWRLGHAHKSQLPNARGFDHFYGHMNAEIDDFEHTEQGGLDWQRNGKGLGRRAIPPNWKAMKQSAGWRSAIAAGRSAFIFHSSLCTVHSRLRPRSSENTSTSPIPAAACWPRRST